MRSKIKKIKVDPMTQQAQQARPKPAVKAQQSHISGENTTTSIKVKETAADPLQKVQQEVAIDKDIKEIRENFDLKKAVIYKEILEPKFKEY